MEFEYYHICKTQLWLFSHGIDVGNYDAIVRNGKAIHNLIYKREKREILLDRCKFDVIKIGDEWLVYERKRKKFTRAAFLQLKFYLYKLWKKGVKARGILIVPRKRIRVRLRPKDVRYIEKVLEEIKAIITSPTPPKPKKCRYCKKCAYREFCFGGCDE